jgi:hypothetical protein
MYVIRELRSSLENDRKMTSAARKSFERIQLRDKVKNMTMTNMTMVDICIVCWKTP